MWTQEYALPSNIDIFNKCWRHFIQNVINYSASAISIKLIRHANPLTSWIYIYIYTKAIITISQDETEWMVTICY